MQLYIIPYQLYIHKHKFAGNDGINAKTMRSYFLKFKQDFSRPFLKLSNSLASGNGLKECYLLMTVTWNLNISDL